MSRDSCGAILTTSASTSLGTPQGAEWIDHLARAANEQLDGLATGEVVVGHTDYRVEHLRFTEGRVSAVYDWDCLAVGPEPVASAAYAFTADWGRDDCECVPTLEESLAFIADYETARGAPFTATERQATSVAVVAALTYGARCEHSDRLTDFRRPTAGSSARNGAAGRAPRPAGHTRSPPARHQR